MTDGLTYGLTASRIATLRVRSPQRERDAASILVPVALGATAGHLWAVTAGKERGAS